MHPRDAPNLLAISDNVAIVQVEFKHVKIQNYTAHKYCSQIYLLSRKTYINSYQNPLQFLLQFTSLRSRWWHLACKHGSIAICQCGKTKIKFTPHVYTHPAHPLLSRRFCYKKIQCPLNLKNRNYLVISSTARHMYWTYFHCPLSNWGGVGWGGSNQALF